MFNFLVKNPTDLLIGRPLETSRGSFLVGRNQKRYNRPVEVWILSLNDISLVGRATFCSILKLSFDLIRRYIVLYFLPNKLILLPTNDKIKGLICSQNGANIHSSVPTSLQYPTINLYTSVVDFIYFRPLVESPLFPLLCHDLGIFQNWKWHCDIWSEICTIKIWQTRLRGILTTWKTHISSESL